MCYNELTWFFVEKIVLNEKGLSVVPVGTAPQMQRNVPSDQIAERPKCSMLLESHPIREEMTRITRVFSVLRLKWMWQIWEFQKEKPQKQSWKFFEVGCLVAVVPDLLLKTEPLQQIFSTKSRLLQISRILFLFREAVPAQVLRRQAELSKMRRSGSRFA